MDNVLLTDGSNKKGLKHIIKKHLGDGKSGKVDIIDIINMGSIIRESKPYISRSKKTNSLNQIYEETKNGIKYKVVVYKRDGKEEIITSYSDKKKDKSGGGGTHNGTPSSSHPAKGFTSADDETIQQNYNKVNNKDSQISQK